MAWDFVSSFCARKNQMLPDAIRGSDWQNISLLAIPRRSQLGRSKAGCRILSTEPGKRRHFQQALGLDLRLAQAQRIGDDADR